MQPPIDLLLDALAHRTEDVQVASVRDLVIETKRQNRKRPAEIRLAVPDDIAKALRGPAERGPELLMVIVKRGDGRMAQKRAEVRAVKSLGKERAK